MAACTLLNPAEEPLPFVPSDIANLVSVHTPHPKMPDQISDSLPKSLDSGIAT